MATQSTVKLSKVSIKYRGKVQPGDKQAYIALQKIVRAAQAKHPDERISARTVLTAAQHAVWDFRKAHMSKKGEFASKLLEKQHAKLVEVLYTIHEMYRASLRVQVINRKPTF